jgi:Zn finger protein HypA/HybF involved in hydrogenase expression
MENKVECYCPCCGDYLMQIPLSHISPGMVVEKECPQCHTIFGIKIEYEVIKDSDSED